MSTKSKTEVYTEQSRSGAKKPSFYIITFGCQMNVYDSNLMASLLEKEGYEGALRVEDADVIIVNTCAVRHHATERAMTRIRGLKNLKEEKPELRIGVTGCISQIEKQHILNEIPFVDFVLGTDSLKEISSCAANRNGVFSDFGSDAIYSELAPARGKFPEAFVSVMRGCNNFCSYCIVPYARGKVKSRKFEHIIEETVKLRHSGYKRIILLGQNANDYKDRGKGLPHLLKAITKVKGIERIGFLTSHPAFFPLDIFDVMKDEPKIERFLHLPLQSGSDRVLKLMNRGYTVSQYLEIVEKARNKIDDIALSTDIIVGFPYETEKDFTNTLKVISDIRFNSAFMFKYSPRKYTLANSLGDMTSETEKKERLQRLIKIQSAITKEKNMCYKGKTLKVLITGKNRKNSLESDGITVYNKKVVVTGQHRKGEMLKVKISDIKGWTPIGITANQM